MDFVLKNLSENIVTIARAIGYVIIDTTDNEYNMVRKLHHDNYPRFHIYVTKQGRQYSFSLHLDQKAPVYKNSHAHNGEYWGPVVENEADRVREILQ